MTVELTKLKSGPKKFEARFYDKDGKKIKSVSFGARGYEDYTSHHDKERMKKYVDRHRKREDWSRSGRFSPGFWSRWLLWSDPSLMKAIKITEGKLGDKIIYKK
jgi:hypothetical protein